MRRWNDPADRAAVAAAVRDELAALRRRRRRRGRRLAVLAATAALLALLPALTLAANFVDLNTGGPHNKDINTIADAGISKGCTDAQHYCPNAFVTREQMASFLARTAGLGGNPPVANAQTAVTAQNAVTAQVAANATTAGNANTVGGYAPDGLLRVARVTRTSQITVTASFETRPFPAAFASYTSVSIVAPGDGFVLVNGSIYAAMDDAAGFARLRHVATGATSLVCGCGVAVGLDGCSIAPVYVFPVSAGAQTFALEVVKQRSAGTLIVDEGTITALYVPFGADGGAALTAP